MQMWERNKERNRDGEWKKYHFFLFNFEQYIVSVPTPLNPVDLRRAAFMENIYPREYRARKKLEYERWLLNNMSVDPSPNTEPYMTVKSNSGSPITIIKRINATLSSSLEYQSSLLKRF